MVTWGSSAKHTAQTLCFFHMCAPYLVSEEYIHTWRYPSAFLVLRRVLLLLGFGLGPFWWIFLIFIFACRNQLPRWLPHFFHVVSMLDQLDQLPSTPTFHGICFAPFHVVLFDARHVYLQYIPLESGEEWAMRVWVWKAAMRRYMNSWRCWMQVQISKSMDGSAYWVTLMNFLFVTQGPCPYIVIYIYICM